MESEAMDWAGPIIQLATATGFGGLVWYMMVRHIPSIEKRHQDERREWLTYITKRDDDFEELSKQGLTTANEVRAEVEKLRTAIDDLRKTK